MDDDNSETMCSYLGIMEETHFTEPGQFNLKVKFLTCHPLSFLMVGSLSFVPSHKLGSLFIMAVYNADHLTIGKTTV